MNFKVLTYNIQHGVDQHSETREINLDQIADIIGNVGADIVNLNEVYGAGEFPGKPYEMNASYIASKCGYNYSFFSPAITANGRPYGNAFFSKYPILFAEIIPIPDPLRKTERVHYESRVILKTVIKPEGKCLTVFSSHFGVAKNEERNAVDLMCDLISEENNDIICMGDFNITPDNEITAPLLKALKNTSADNEPTFPSYSPEIKIDYILVSENVDVIGGKPLNIIASDHFPYVAELNI